MSEVPDSSKPEIPEEISEREKEQIVLWSYKLSQGSSQLQGFILRFVVDWYQMPIQSFEKNLKNMFQKVEDIVQRGGHKSLSEEEKQDERVEQRATIHNVKEEINIHKVIVTMLRKDRAYLIKRKGRPGRADRRDKMRSYILYYGRDGNKTGLSVYDAFMKEVWQACQDTENSELQRILAEIESVHIDNWKDTEKKSPKEETSGKCPYGFGRQE